LIFNIQDQKKKKTFVLINMMKSKGYLLSLWLHAFVEKYSLIIELAASPSSSSR